jgi:hypothetical protein
MQEYLWEEHFVAKSRHNDRRQVLDARRAELDGFIQRGYEDKVRGRISEEQWQTHDLKWQHERAEIVAEYDSMMNQQDEYIARGVSLIELMQQSEIIFKNATPEKKRKMVELVSSNLLLKDGTLRFSWRKPFDMLVKTEGKEDWRPQPRLAWAFAGR